MEIIEAIYQPRQKGIIDTQPGQIREFSSCSTILSKWPIQWYVMFHKSLAKHVVRLNTVYSFEPTSISEFSNVSNIFSNASKNFPSEPKEAPVSLPRANESSSPGKGTVSTSEVQVLTPRQPMLFFSPKRSWEHIQHHHLKHNVYESGLYD